MQKFPTTKFSVAIPKDLPEPCYFLTIPRATHIVIRKWRNISWRYFAW